MKGRVAVVKSTETFACIAVVAEVRIFSGHRTRLAAT